jgi:hypothetical protein
MYCSNSATVSKYVHLAYVVRPRFVKHLCYFFRQVEDDLEIMWKAATADNRRMQDTMERTFRKLREHKALEFMFNEDTECKELLGFSSDNDA